MSHLKNQLRLIVIVAIVTASATLVPARDTDQTRQGNSKQNAKIDTSYDPIKEITTVRLTPMQVYGEPVASSNYIGSDEASFDASFTYSGRTLRAQPKRVLLSLISTSQDWKYTDFRKLTAIVDGRRLKLGQMEHVPSFTVNASANVKSDDYISQALAVSLPYKTFLRITNGEKVRIRMGPREFVLDKNHLDALRYFATQMVP